MAAKKNLFLIVLFIGCTCSAMAQKKAKEADKKDSIPSYFKLSAGYLSNAVYNGRKDSMVLPYITPSIGYYNKSGLYISGSVSYLAAASENRIDLFALEAGYNFNISNNISADINGSKYFYNNSSTSVSSEMKGSLGGDVSYDPGIISLNAGVYLSFASKTDVFFSGAIAHGFYFGDKENAWSITPGIATNLGTQNFYQAYIKNRKYAIAGSGRGRSRSGARNGGGATISTINVTGYQKFSVLDYELSLPVTYDGKKWGISFIPTYAIPQSPVASTLPNGSVYIMENLENIFYAGFTVYLKF